MEIIVVSLAGSFFLIAAECRDIIARTSPSGARFRRPCSEETMQSQVG